MSLLNARNMSEGRLFKNRDYYFHLIFKNLNYRISKGYEQNDTKMDITSLCVALKKANDLNCRKVDKSNSYHSKQRKLKYTQVKNKKNKRRKKILPRQKKIIMRKRIN